MSPMLKRWIVIDVASAPIADAASFLEGTIKAPSNYKDPAKIAEYVAEKEAERLAMAATDLDLARVTCIGLVETNSAEPIGPEAMIASNEDAERHMFTQYADAIRDFLHEGYAIVTYGGSRFDLPLLMRRARYLGVEFPRVDLDRFRSPHVDLCDLLSDRDPSRRRPLDFYVKRLGWSDLLPKPMDGAEEAQIFTHGRWDDLRRSVARDVEAVRRLAVWCGVV